MAQYDGSIRIGTKINTEGFEKDAEKLKKSAKSQAATLAAQYRKEGMSASDAFKKAWSEIERSGKFSSKKVAKHWGKSGRESTKNFFSGFKILGGIKTREVDIRSSFERMTKSAKNFISAIATAFAARQIFDFGKEAIQAAADFEAMESQFSQVFGEIEKQAATSLSRIADQSGIIKERMKPSFTKIAAFAKTTGMDTASAMELANRAMVAVADSAAFYDRSLEETTESLQSFLKGNYENDAALGLSATETTRNAAANKLYGKSFIELSEAQKQLTLLQMVEDANKLSGALGQAAREADTWTNQTGNLNQAWTNLKANLGKFILPMAVQAVKAITNVINAINRMLSSLYTAASAFRSFSELITGNKSVEGSASGFSDAADSAGQLADANKDVADSAKKAAKETKGQLSTLDKLNNTVTKENDSGSGAGSDTGIGILTGQEVDYGKLAEGETFADDLADSFKNIWDVFYKAWQSKGKSVIESAKGMFESLAETAKSIGETLYGVFTSNVGLGWVESLLERFKSILDTIRVISDAFRTAWNSGDGEENITALFNMLTEINRLLSTIRDSFNRVFSNGTGAEIWGNILGIITGVYDIVGNLSGRFTEAWETAGLGDKIWQGILDIINTILGTIHNIVDSTAEWAEKLDFTPLLESINRLLESLEPLTANVGSGLEWFWNNVLLPIAGWVIEDAVPVFLDMLSAAISAVNEVIEALKPLGQWLWDEFLEPIGQWAGEVFISAMEKITGLLQKFGDWISEHQEAVQNMAIIVASFFAAFKIATAIKGLVDFIGKIKNTITTVGGMSKLITTVFNPWTLAIGAVIAAGVLLYKNWDVIKEKAAQLKEWLIQKWEAIKQGASEIWGGIKAAISGAWENIKNIVSSAANAVKTTVSTIWNAIKSVTSSIWNGIKNTISNLINGIKNTISNVMNSIKNIWDGIWDKIFGKVGNILGSIKDAIGKAFDWIADKVSGILEKIGLINKTEIKPKYGASAFSVGGSVGNIPRSVSLPQAKIPGYATGQVIPRTMRQHLAILGDNNRETEVVSPLSTIKKALREEALSLGLTGGNSGGVREITLNIAPEVDGMTLFKIIKKIDLEEYQRTRRPNFQM